MTYYFSEYHPPNILRDHLNLGANDIRINSLYFERGGKPWIGVMGEYHFSRDCRDHWKTELLRMKAGGITIASTYVFWIYHEELEGKFDFAGDRDLRTFLQDCREVGLDVFLRIGPWAHGECRNGGFPDWLMEKPFEKRSNNPCYMEKVRNWYGQIFQQAKGLLYKDGGPVIGIQIENELVDKPDHLLALKQTAKETGFDVPLWTVTGWNSQYGAKIPVDEFVPVFGAYVDAPWAKTTQPLLPSPHYVFDPIRNDAVVGMDVIEKTDADGWRLPYERYPFATCELGAGLMPTHHRRPIVSGIDAYILSLVKLGSGNNFVGYYMYHGGTNKIGVRSTLQESKASGYPNDYPILNYDFHTCLTQYGEVREQYRLLNLLHLFVQDFGELLAPMTYVPPCSGGTALRYCMRTDGKSGFVFINHHQRLAVLPDVHDVVVDTGPVTFPSIDVCGEIGFILPFSLRLGESVLEYATAQLICKQGSTYFFTALPGIQPEYKFSAGVHISAVPGFDSTIQHGKIQLVTLAWDEARFLRRLGASLFVGVGCDLYEENGVICSVQGGSFSYYRWNGNSFSRHSVGRPASTAKLMMNDVPEPFVPLYVEELNLGGRRKRRWKKIAVTSGEGFVEFPEICDVSQIYADGELVADNFYYGEPWRVPAKLLWGKECYLVMSELRDDFYREF